MGEFSVYSCFFCLPFLFGGSGISFRFSTLSVLHFSVPYVVSLLSLTFHAFPFSAMAMVLPVAIHRGSAIVERVAHSSDKATEFRRAFVSRGPLVLS